jgi:hypothetical protein
MNLSQVIHEKWAANSTLNGLLPVAQFHTGTYFATDPEFPYATLTRPSGGSTTARMNDGHRIDTVTVRIAVYHGADNYDEGVVIADAVDDAFDKLDFDLSNSDRVIQMMIDGPAGEIQDDEGNWAWVTDFTCTIHRAA